MLHLVEGFQRLISPEEPSSTLHREFPRSCALYTWVSASAIPSNRCLHIASCLVSLERAYCGWAGLGLTPEAPSLRVASPQALLSPRILEQRPRRLDGEERSGSATENPVRSARFLARSQD